MTFGRKVHHRPDTVIAQQLGYEFAISDVAVHERVCGTLRKLLQILRIAGVSQPVDVHHWLVTTDEPLLNKVASNEPGSACHKDGHPRIVAYRSRESRVVRS